MYNGYAVYGGSNFIDIVYNDAFFCRNAVTRSYNYVVSSVLSNGKRIMRSGYILTV